MYNVTELLGFYSSLKCYETYLTESPSIDSNSQALKQLLADKHNITTCGANVKNVKKPCHSSTLQRSSIEAPKEWTLYQTIKNSVCTLNFHIAMIHLSYLQEANFNGTLPDWDFSFSLETFTQVDDTTTRDNDPNIIKAHAFRLPLHIAVLVSPVFLLSGFRIYKYPWERDSLLEYSFRLGNMKPEILLRVERLIWAEFFSVCNNTKTLHDATTTLVKHIPWDELANTLPEILPQLQPTYTRFIACLTPSGSSELSPIGEQSDVCLLDDIEVFYIVTCSFRIDFQLEYQQGYHRVNGHLLQGANVPPNQDVVSVEDVTQAGCAQLQNCSGHSDLRPQGDNDVVMQPPMLSKGRENMGYWAGNNKGVLGWGESEGQEAEDRENRSSDLADDRDEGMHQDLDQGHGEEGMNDARDKSGVEHVDKQNDIVDENNRNHVDDKEDENDQNDQQEKGRTPRRDGLRERPSPLSGSFISTSVKPTGIPPTTKKRKYGKRTPGANVVKSSTPPSESTNPKSAPLDPLTVLKQEIAIIEEEAQRRWVESEDTTLHMAPAVKNHSCTISVFHIDGHQSDITLNFHEEFVCRQVSAWHKVVEQNYVVKDGIPQPRWLADPASSTFAIIDHSDLHDLPQVHYLLRERKKNIVVKNVPGKRRTFGLAALQEVQRVNHVVDIHVTHLHPHKDHSIKCAPRSLGKHLRSGTLAQVLECASMENGKILNALDLLMPTALLEESSFMTDLVSWRLAMGELNCPRGKEYPISKLRWALVTTKGGTHWVHIDNDGFATFIHVRTGAKWWIIATPKEGFEDVAEFAHLEKRYDASLPCPDMWNYEAVLLTEGMMLIMHPNTRHAVFTVNHTIVAGGYFYNTACLADSIKAMIHCFNADGAVTNSNTPASRPALQRILSFFYVGLVKKGVHHETDEFQHLPVLESTSGCRKFLVACVIGVAMIFFDFKAYDCGTTNPMGLNTSGLTRQEREQYMYVRGLSYTLVEWLDHHYNIQVDVGQPNMPASTSSCSFDSILFAIGQFLGDIVCYQRRAQSSRIDGAPGCNPDIMEGYIREIFCKNGATNSVYHGYHVRAKEIAIVGDENHHITYGPIFTGTWHAKKRCDVGIYQAKDLQGIMSMGQSDAERDMDWGSIGKSEGIVYGTPDDRFEEESNYNSSGPYCIYHLNMTNRSPENAHRTDCFGDGILHEPFFLQSEKDVTQLLSTARSLREQHIQTKEGLIQQLKIVVDALRRVEQRLATLDLQPFGRASAEYRFIS
ncbi:hypothetical protein BJ165DRAFT_1550248 [Panaeolus papilionaceus]|nr:hypothetical protein BJ165DRAFT_1550248 [Panaeolus papilionaceus]